MKYEINLTEDDVKTIIAEHLTEKFKRRINKDDIRVEAKSKQNYRSEWEEAAWRCKIDLVEYNPA